MKKLKNNVLFIDKTVASKNFACYFLDNNNLFFLDNFSLEDKKKIKFNLVFIFCSIDLKLIDNLSKLLTEDGIVLTNNFQSYLVLTNNNIKVGFVNLDLFAEFNVQTKLTMQCNLELNLDNFTQNILIKQDEKIIEKELCNIIVSNAVNSVSCLKNTKINNLLWHNTSRKLIINLIEEQIKITNSVLVDVNVSNINLYKFLTGKSVFSIFKRHIKLFMFLSNYKTQISKSQLIYNLEQIISLNYNKFVEIKFLQKVLTMLTNN